METTLETRWSDFDSLGHLTHAAYPVLLDEARDRMIQAAVGGFEAWPYVIAHLSIDFRAEIRYPAPAVVVRTRVVEVGRSSVSLGQELGLPGGEPAAVSRSVVVAWDSETRASRAIGDAARAALSDLGG